MTDYAIIYWNDLDKQELDNLLSLASHEARAIGEYTLWVDRKKDIVWTYDIIAQRFELTESVDEISRVEWLMIVFVVLTVFYFGLRTVI